MDDLARKMAIYVIEQGIVEKDEYKVYKYGFQTGLETGLCLLVSAIVSFCLSALIEFLVVTVTFFVLRAYVGGIHLKHFISCFLCSCMTIITGVLLAQNVVLADGKFFLCIILMMVIIHKLALLTMKKMLKEKKSYIMLYSEKEYLLLWEYWHIYYCACI